MITALLLGAAALLSGSQPAAETTYQWTAPDAPFVKGVDYPVSIRIETPNALEIPGWMLEPAGFTINGQPLEKRDNAKVRLAAGSKLTLELDLAPILSASKLTDAREFRLGWGGDKGGPEKTVACMEAAPQGLDFLKMSDADLAGWQVLLVTNRGAMRVEFYPDSAPGHVRNFLDLSYTKFYDDLQFHRVSPTFMIQGGCPNTRGDNKTSWGMGSSPRGNIKAEFSARKHERGILSMARGPDKDSASSQFFIMTGVNPGLDGKYSVFGKLVDGMSTLDSIANAQGFTNPDGTIRPKDPQRIQRAIVIRVPQSK